MKKIISFLDERTDFRRHLTNAMDEQVSGGARWAHVFGASLLVFLLVEAVTGTLLMLTYTPALNGAWSSVYFIQHRMTAGWFIRGLHAYSAHAMLVLMGVHMMQVVIYGAYKKPREITYWFGLALMALLLGFAITGYRLPWDQRTFWALKVEVNVTQSMPVVGGMLTKLLLGGPDIGQGALTHLYAAHVFLLPAAVVGVVALKLGLIRRHGRTPPPGADLSVSQPVFPNQAVKDGLFALVALAVVVAWTIHTHGETLDAPAEPNRFYPARPEWFILPLYKLRVLMPPSMEVLVTAVMPAVLGGALFLLPLVDRRPTPKWGQRIAWAIPVVGIFLGSAGLIAYSMKVDAGDKHLQADLKEAQARADRSMVLASAGIPPEGPNYMLDHDPLTRGRDVYRQYCTGCHLLEGEGKRKSPDHDGFGSRPWIMGVLVTPKANNYFGLVKHAEHMPSQKKLGPAKLRAITEFMFSLGQEKGDAPADASLVAKGEDAFRENCLDCHMFKGEGDDLAVGGPNLTAWGSRSWIAGQIRHPGRDSQYGALRKMPSFDDQLSDNDILMAAGFLRHQRFASSK